MNWTSWSTIWTNWGYNKPDSGCHKREAGVSSQVLVERERLERAYQQARDTLLAERVPSGHWVGELSASALSTATAVMALHLVNPFVHAERIAAGWRWLVQHQNPDGGWGDTTKSFSNISTAMLVRAALRLTGMEKEQPEATRRVEEYLSRQAGPTAQQRAAAIRQRYGADRTFSVPILMSCALSGLLPWSEVPRLPFELAALPQSWYRWARLPVVSYALPALIALGQCVHVHRGNYNPLTALIRRLVWRRTTRILRHIQPTSGGYLEAIPLTSFVVMALVSLRSSEPLIEQIITAGTHFLVQSQRPDGSWPIDTNLATWVSTLAVNALAAAHDLEILDSKQHILQWLLQQQYRQVHPYTGAAPGGWAWTDLPGGVPDCDDTPGAILALEALGQILGQQASIAAPVAAARRWVLSLQNRDGGFPTFCRGWGRLPFDRSGPDLTAHALRALAYDCITHNCSSTTAANTTLSDHTNTLDGLLTKLPAQLQLACQYLRRQQQPDGSWLPLWFGNQYAPEEANPVYGTSRVLAAYRDLGLTQLPECRRGVQYLLTVQNADGGWGGAQGCPSSVEETALAVEALIDLQPTLAQRTPLDRGLLWLIEAVETQRYRQPSPIGLYFAKLWYYEKLYPIIFTVAALGRARHRMS
jgi:squalene-hopene/tetraprenyl-beta-curcumene cyclase